MACNQGKKSLSCPYCKENEDFQTIVDLESIGLAIYRYMIPTKDVNDTGQLDNVTRIAGDMFILHNTKSMNINASQYLPVLNSSEISCPRCRKILEHAKKLLQSIPTIQKNEIRGFCDYCSLKQKTCEDCENVIKKFISNQKELSADTKKRIKHWLMKMSRIIEMDQAFESRDTNRRRTHSDLSIDLLNAAKHDHLLNVKQLFQTGSLKKTELHENLARIGQDKKLNIKIVEKSISEQLSNAHLYNSHLKEKRLKTFEHIPPARHQSIDGSFTNPDSTLKSKSWDPYVPGNVDKGADGKHVSQKSKASTLGKNKRDSKTRKEDTSYDANKLEKNFSTFRRFFSEESLLTVTAASSKTELLKKYYTFYFPKKIKKQHPKKNLSSSELIKTTNDKLEKQEEQKNEMQRIAKFDAEENKEKDQEEKERMLEAKKLADKSTMEEKLKFMTLYKSEEEQEKQGDEEDGKSDYVGRVKEEAGEKLEKGGENETQVKIRGKREKGEEGVSGKEGEKGEREGTSESGGKRETLEKGKREEKGARNEKSERREKGEKGGKGESLEKTQKENSESGVKEAKKDKEKRVDKEPTEQKEPRKQKEPRGGKAPSEQNEPKGEKVKRGQKEKKDKNESRVQKEPIEQKEPIVQKEMRIQKESRVEKEPKGQKEPREQKEPRVEKEIKAHLKDKEIKLQNETIRENDQRDKRVQQESIRENKTGGEIDFGDQSKIGEKKDKKGKGISAERKEIDEKSGKGERIEKARTTKKVTQTGTSQIAGNEKEKTFKDEKPKDSKSQTAKSETEKKDDQIRQTKEEIEKKVEEKQDKAKPKNNEPLMQKNKTGKEKREKDDTGKLKDDLICTKKDKNVKLDLLQENKNKYTGKDQKLISIGKHRRDTDQSKGNKKKETKKKLEETTQGKPKTTNVQFPDEIHRSINNEVKYEDIKVSAEEDDIYLKLVRIKQLKYKGKKPKGQLLPQLSLLLHKHHSHYNKEKCPFCESSELEFVVEDIIREEKEENEIIIGPKIFKLKPYLIEKPAEPRVIPLFFKTTYLVKEQKIIKPQPRIELKAEPESPPKPIPTKKSSKSQPKTAEQIAASKGITRYALSDRSFIDKGWTMLPTEKVVKKMNVYRMRPAQPELDWFKQNKNKRLMTYDTGEKLAEFNDNGRGRWFYRNGHVALDYYDAEEANAQQRLVIYSNGEPDSRGRSQPFTVLATFDYLGNGIVFDHSGKIRLKYNQSEGVILDRSLGPTTHWKWHTLNDPPVLQQIMIDTQASQKDPDIMNLSTGLDKPQRKDNEEMLAIEFDNFIKEKSKKLRQTFKPFKIKMKAVKINEYFSLKVLDQATVYLLYRDGTTHMKLNIGMKLDHKEIVDTDISEIGEVSNNIERLPAKSDSLHWIQKKIAGVQRYDRVRSERERSLKHPVAKSSADILTAATSRPLQPPLRTVLSSSSVATNNCNCSRKPSKNNLYYDTRVF